MKEYVLSYYPLFKCIAGECKHTCCAGWEMCIDEQSLKKYKQNDTAFSTLLSRGIDFKKSKFKRDKFKRCAFLNDKGLCEIITNLGKESLCQVCRDHPRFRSFYNDRIETGLGFCCESATRIILSTQDKIFPVLISDDGLDDKLDFNQKNVLDFRDKALDIIQDRSIEINDRIERILSLCKAKISERDLKKVLKTFLSFERIDKGWIKTLKNESAPLKIDTEQDLSVTAEQFLVNGLYRHLSDAEDTMWVRARTIALVVSWWIIIGVVNQYDKKTTFDDLVDAVRAFSCEVEYSEKNVNKLFNLCYKFIRI